MGSSVLVWKTRRVYVGDVIAFRLENDPERVLIKRVAEQMAQDTYRVAGDNKQDSRDVGRVRADEIIGRVVFSY